MESIENIIEQVVNVLQSIAGLPAVALTAFACIVVGYVLKCIKKFPNDGIPIVVILWGMWYVVIADANNDMPLRVWIGRNLFVGLGVGFLAWLVHNKFLSKLEDKLGLFGKTAPTVNPTPTPPTPATPPAP